ncbi:hypothetical protein BDZ89DRAFT_887173, partial [Hymenopellis radicata]
CYRCIKHHAFISIPIYAWANGCWVGDVPEELAGLTFAEEIVIARAHATKSWIKLNAEHSCLRQRAASGNVCLHPHEIIELTSKLPLPMTSLFDEIVVIVVTDGAAATAEMFERTPLLVRRDKVFQALWWLKRHNRLYRDIEIDWPALYGYNPNG